MIAMRVLGLWIARWFGCGLFPYGPGTIGALGAIPLHFAFARLPLGAHVAAVAALTLVGIWASSCAVAILRTDDPQQVVIDEVAGTLIAMTFVRDHSAWALLAAFIAFRLLDIFKPGPIDTVQRLRPEGLGIMADDILAGFGAGLLALLIP
jgi:phosphatidylglycerophosphatase A